MSLVLSLASNLLADVAQATEVIEGAPHQVLTSCLHVGYSMVIGVVATAGFIWAIKAMALGWVLGFIVYILASLLWAYGYSAVKGNTACAKAACATANGLHKLASLLRSKKG